ncbi:MAG TPA: hypothetical protein VH024_07915 [Candidatus Angelobacter sp.]|jgi:hypothetical protein|nr:hypothetical protein [Candidatus Angelobacter sp.]
MEHKPFPPDATKPPQSKFPWPLVALAVAAVLLIAIFWLMPRTDKAATSAINSSTQPSPQVRIADVRISPQNVNGPSNVDVYGQATNTGSRPITEAIVSAVFRDKNGNPFLTQQEPMQAADSKNAEVPAVKDLSEKPLKPGQATAFRVRYSQVPGTWDGKPPELSILQVTVQK